MELKLINKHSGKDLFYSNEVVADFLYNHLDEFGDKKTHILKAVDYVFDDPKGGHVLLGLENKKIVGAVVINETGMSGYIPENVLVYIAVHRDRRGEGLGKELMMHSIRLTTGNIALHVEHDNPALHLYKKVGFTNKYLEMRFNKS